ncbi:MAG: ABC transporter permease, partial [Planctomycetes bacterium]|nr:ABC transporter permease [Planctomycetota bacterium]
MRRRVVMTILRRELRDVLRDRRTLFTMLVLPVLLYPALMLGFSSLAASRVEELKEQTYAVMITVDGEPLARGQLPPNNSLAAKLLRVKRFAFTMVADPRAAVESGDIFLACEIPGDLDERLKDRQEVRLEPLYRSADEHSRIVWNDFKGAVLSYRTDRVPLVIDNAKGDQSTPEQKGGHLFGGMLTMMVIMMAMTGAFYPALDIAAGEKERGTLETLLLSPVGRVELVAGKYLTVLAVAVFAALMNLGSMTLTFAGFSRMVPQGQGGLSFSISPLAFAVIFVGLVVMAGLFSAICLAVSTFARTYKEGQAYLTPALLLVMPLAMIGLLPNMEIDPSLAVIPVANMALLMKALLLGEFPGPEIAITLVTCLACAFAALLWTASLFNREEVLFREGKQVFGLKPPPGVPRPVRPPVQAAVLGVLLGVVWMVHVGGRLLDAPAWAQIVIP